MNYNGEQGYLDLLQDVLDNGVDRPDRTGTGTRSVFGRQLRYDLSQGIPFLTTKKMDLKSVLSELLWFIEGSGDERRLAEIRFGKDRSELETKNTIWTANAKAPYWANKSAYEGDLGRVYGVQWRRWTNRHGEEIDQIQNLINDLKSNPYSRRHLVMAWNPGELDEMALPPCHLMADFYVANNKLSCMYTMRSNDLFLGQPYNSSSYGIMVHMIAQVCGFEVGEVIFSGADVHLYDNHFDAVKEQITRVPRALPKLVIDPSVKSIFDFKMEHFSLIDYDPYPNISAPMAV